MVKGRRSTVAICDQVVCVGEHGSESRVEISECQVILADMGPYANYRGNWVLRPLQSNGKKR